MQTLVDPIQLTFSRATLRDVHQLSNAMIDRMHALLERNTDGELSDAERSELEGLVRIAHFGQAVASALEEAAHP
jgi:demethoxyubiquinone hydroxylase (CLK1/Coq7/Cat5 family)